MEVKKQRKGELRQEIAAKKKELKRIKKAEKEKDAPFGAGLGN